MCAWPSDGVPGPWPPVQPRHGRCYVDGYAVNPAAWGRLLSPAGDSLSRRKSIRADRTAQPGVHPAPRQPVVVRDTSVQLEFLRVSGDSRGPAGFFCIQVGDAIVQLRATSGGSIDYELHTGDQARTVVSHGPIRIEFVQLQPYLFRRRRQRRSSARGGNANKGVTCESI